MWPFLQPIIGPIITKALDLIPDKNARAEAKELMERDLQKAVSDASQMQNKVNLAEAKHKSVFVAGWRPFIGWICGVGLAWAYIVQPLVLWYISVAHPGIDTIPQISTDGLYQLVLAMLGMGGLRTFEKMKGVSRE